MDKIQSLQCFGGNCGEPINVAATLNAKGGQEEWISKARLS